MVEKEKDIVVFLRGCDDPMMLVAADEIERLREHVTEAENRQGLAEIEIERLRAKLKQAEDFIRSDVPCVITTAEERAALGQERGKEISRDATPLETQGEWQAD